MRGFISSILLLAATSSMPGNASIVEVHTSATGSSSASAIVQTQITSNDGGSVVQVDTSINGISHHGTYASKGPIKVAVEASSTGYVATSSAPAAQEAISSSSISASSTEGIQSIPSFFINILQWFGRWRHWFGW